MKKKSTIAETAREVIRKESNSVSNLLNFIDDSFVNAVKLILKSRGRVIITGIGKSAIITKNYGNVKFCRKTVIQTAIS